MYHILIVDDEPDILKGISMPYFYKHFKSYFGISPSTFRPDAEEESQ